MIWRATTLPNGLTNLLSMSAIEVNRYRFSRMNARVGALDRHVASFAPPNADPSDSLHPAAGIHSEIAPSRNELPTRRSK